MAPWPRIVASCYHKPSQICMQMVFEIKRNVMNHRKSRITPKLVCVAITARATLAMALVQFSLAINRTMLHTPLAWKGFEKSTVTWPSSLPVSIASFRQTPTTQKIYGLRTSSALQRSRRCRQERTHTCGSWTRCVCVCPYVYMFSQLLRFMIKLSAPLIHVIWNTH